MMIRRKRMGGVTMIICFLTGNKKGAACQASLHKPEALARVHGRCRGGGGTEAALLPQEMTGQPARRHDPGPAPVLLAAAPGDIRLAQGLVTMNCKVGGVALPEVYRTVALGLGHPLLVGPRGLTDVDDHLLLLV